MERVLAKEKTIHLNRYFHFCELMKDTTIEGDFVRERSDYDGSLLTVFTLRPANKKPKRLFFFFHGMDGDAGDGVVVRDLVKVFSAKIVCLGGRGPSWLSDAFLADAGQIIRQHSKGFSDFILMGVSMGGSQALALAGLLAEKERKKVCGVAVFIPGSNLEAIANHSSHARVKKTLRESMKKESSLLERSPIHLIKQYPKGLPFVMMYREEDTLLLTEELKRFIAELRKSGHPVGLFSAPGNHEFTYTNLDYERVLAELGKDSGEPRPVPLIASSR